MSFCSECQAPWSDGHFDEDCPECGGGALDRACPVCGGKCGSRWQRAIEDSHEQQLAHWVGKCSLPMDEQKVLMMAKVDSPVV